MALGTGTGYYEMFRDVGSAYHRGRAQRRQMDAEDAAEARRQQEFDLRMQGLHRQAGREREADDAFREFGALHSGGVVEGATGLTAPSMQMLASGTTGYGQGEEAVRAAAGDYQREMGRFAQAPGSAGLQMPQFDASAPITRRPATDIELEQGLGRVAAAQRDAAGLRVSTQNARKLKFDEGFRTKAREMTTFLAEHGPSAFVDKFGDVMNKRGDVDGFMTFDPDTGKIVVSSKVGGVVPVDPLDALAYTLGAYQLGEGDPVAGIRMMTDASGRYQGRLDAALTRSRNEVQMQLQSWKARQDAANDAARTRAYTANAGAKGSRGEDDIKNALELMKIDPSKFPTPAAALMALRAARTGADPMAETIEKLKALNEQRGAEAKKEKTASTENAEQGLRLKPRDANVTHYGMATPWSTIERNVRDGDPAAIQYAQSYLRNNSFGGTMPDSLRAYMMELNAQ